MPEDQEVPQPTRLSKEDRSRIATEAAKRRWAKAREQRTKAVTKGVRTVPKAPPGHKRPAAPREFSTALKAAEKRLAKALEERAFHAYQYNALCAEIPSLADLVKSLRNPLGSSPMPGVAIPPTVTIEQIVGDQVLGYKNPPILRPTGVAAIPVPQQLHPVNAVTGRGGGGAVGMQIEEPEDEDKFLTESGVAGGQWH